MMRAILSHADLDGAVLATLPLGGGRSMPTNLSDAGLRYARLVATDFTGALMDRADLTGARMDDVVLSDAQRASLTIRRAAA